MKGRICLLLAAALTASLLAGCQVAAEPEAGENGALLYYLLPEEEARGGDRLRGIYAELPVAENAGPEEMARAVVERLLEGDPEGKLLSPMPPDVTVNSLEVRDRWVYVDFSDAFNRLSGVELTLADYCLTLSLTALEWVSAVSVTVQGRPVPRQPKQVFYERDVLLSDMDDVLHTEEVTLYFLNSDGALAGERRTIEVYEGQTIAENLVAALLSGPENRELSRAIPEAFQVSFVRVDSGVCSVAIPAASLTALPPDEWQQRMILWSLANSLYSLSSVEEIHFISEGEELENFGMVPVAEVAARPVG